MALSWHAAHHAWLIIAEQFGTLAALHLGRIDLGLAPGTDQIAACAMRRNLAGVADQFPQDMVELLLFHPAEARPGAAGRAGQARRWRSGSLARARRDSQDRRGRPRPREGDHHLLDIQSRQSCIDQEE
jgi:alkanesulfonate monooxygenase SsuD/methylene tetrahydromethanopterin reductase-like flavin-dependent oxidoreductase (luciferase family)